MKLKLGFLLIFGGYIYGNTLLTTLPLVIQISSLSDGTPL